jgi:hypothetical protein
VVGTHWGLQQQLLLLLLALELALLLLPLGLHLLVGGVAICIWLLMHLLVLGTVLLLRTRDHIGC